ncbi:MAG: FtsX-like permease family protein [Micromonosporaceae bacterium]
MRPAALLRLALAGSRTDTVRIVLTAFAAALATLSMLAAATVYAIRPRADVAVREAADHDPTMPGVDPAPDGYAYQYTHNLLVEPGLRPGVVFGLLLLCIPVLALAGQSARLGAPARDRRLARIRLAGATPRQAVAVVVAETGLAALAGTALGMVVYAVGRALLHRPDASGRLPLPTDTAPPLWTLLAVGAGLPLLAALSAALLLRRVAFTPFGVARRHRTRPPRPWPGALIVLGVAAIAAAPSVARAYAWSGRTMPVWVPPVLLVGGAALATVGVILGTAWISHATGRVLHRLARGPAALLAARRLTADPWAGSRVFAAMLVAVVVGAGAVGIRAWFTAEFSAREEAWSAIARAAGWEHVPEDTSFYFSSLDLVDAAVTVGLIVAGLGLLVYLAEGLVSRRRAYAALVATGMPRRTLARAVGWQMLAPAVPAILLALTVGLAMARGYASEVRAAGAASFCTVDDESRCGEGSPFVRTIEVDVVRPVGIPFAELAQVGAVALAAVVVTVGIGLLFLRASTDVTELRTE